MKKHELYTLADLAEAWGVTYSRAWQVWKDQKKIMPSPDGFIGATPYWFSIPPKPFDRRKRP